MLATQYTGFSLGFQYVLFSLAIPIVVQADDRKYLRFNNIRTVVSIGVYVLLACLLHFQVLQPKYFFSGTLSLIMTCVIIMIVFVLMNSQIIANFRNYEYHLRDYRQKELEASQRIANVQKRVIRNIAGVIEARDLSTGEHTDRTSEYVEAICRELVKEGKYTSILTEDAILRIAQSAALHDIGKIKTPDAILNKPGKLTPEEFEIIKRHTTDGGEIIRQVFQGIDDRQYEDTAYDIVMYHHEKWDGTGYPEGRKGAEIPLSARIMAVADVYDALISERVYKKAFSKEASLQIIRDDAGTHFDPDVAEAFLRIM